MLPEAFVCIQLADVQRQQRMLRPMADTVMTWRRIELLGTAAILSGYKGTYPVPMGPLGYVLLTHLRPQSVVRSTRDSKGLLDGTA
jgi:hypothetical protein